MYLIRANKYDKLVQVSKKIFKSCLFALPNAKIEKTELGVAGNNKFKQQNS